MQEFPSLLKKLMQKDSSNAIIGGFKATGLYPFSPETALSKLPAETREVTSKVHEVLLKKLATMRYKPAGSTHAPRPKKTDKLPAGASYTCRAGGDGDDGDEPVAGPSKPRQPDSSSSSSSEDYNSSDNESDRERSRTVKNIVQRLARKRSLLDRDEDGDDDEDEEEEQAEEAEEDEQAEEEGTSEETNKDQEKKGGKKNKQEAAVYLPSSFVVAVYGEDWFVGEVRDKEGEPEAEESENYVFISFMKCTAVWPKRLDLLNVLKDDILFSCQAPTLSRATSSSRSTTFSLSKSDLKRANNLFMLYKAYYPTKTLLYLNVCVGCVRLANFFLLGCLYVFVYDVCVSRYSNYKIRYRRYLAI